MLSEILGERGWNTFMVGKWHLCPTDEMNLASTAQLADRPRVRALVRVPRRRDEPVVSGPRLRQPSRRPAARSPRRATTSPTTSPTRRSSSSRTPRPSRRRSRSSSTTRPGACHAPHHAPKEWIEKFKGRFDMGYEAMREQTLARQKEMGIVPADTELPPINPIGTPRDAHRARTASRSRSSTTTRPWDSLNDDEKRLFARMAEVYAGFLAHADHHIGRAARLPRSSNDAARQHADRAWSRTTAPAARAAPTARSTR